MVLLLVPFPLIAPVLVLLLVQLCIFVAIRNSARVYLAMLVPIPTLVPAQSSVSLLAKSSSDFQFYSSLHFHPNRL